MSRFRGKVNVTFINGKNITVEHIAIADDIDTANKKCIIEFNTSYKNNPRVQKFDIIPCELDTTEKPTHDFVKTALTMLCDHTKPKQELIAIKHLLYESFIKYTPNWDDDELSDILSYCEEGTLQEHCDTYAKYHNIPNGLDGIVNELLEELDAEWICHYMPHKPLEEQYLAAIS